MICLEEVLSLDEHHQKTASLLSFDNVIMSKQSNNILCNVDTKKMSPLHLSLQGSTFMQRFGIPPMRMHLLAELLDVLAGLCLWKPEQLSVSAKVEVVRDTSF